MPRRIQSLIVYSGAAVLLAYVLWHGVRATAGVDWPYDIDQFRDIGTAQVLLDGRYPSDLNFRGEKLWYNPLTGAVVALGSWVSGRPAHVIDVRLGPYVNLLVPVTFFLLCRRLFGKWAALLSLAMFLFDAPTAQAGQHLTWGTATYSPWLFAPHLSLSWFFLTLLFFSVAVQAQERLHASLATANWTAVRSFWWFLATGIMLGITFLGHTTAAVVLGATIVCITGERCLRVLRPATGRHPVRQLQAIGIGFAVIVLAAFVVSLPFSISILFHYRLKMRHSFGPVSWLWDYLRLENLGTLWHGFTAPTSCVSLLGLGFLLRSGQEKRPVLYWAVVSFLFLAYSFVHQYSIARGWALWDEFVPSYHFYLFLTASGACLFGFGCTRIWRVGAAALHRLAGPKLGVVRSGGMATLAYGIVLVVFLVHTVPRYGDWVELRPRQPFPCSGTYAWIMRNTGHRDLFLRIPAELDPSESMFLASTRKVVANSAYFSNPYVDYERRKEVQDGLIELVANGDKTMFCSRAWDRAVTYLVVDSVAFHQQVFPPVEPLYTEGSLAVYGVASICGSS